MDKDTAADTKEQQVRKLKGLLEGWRMALLSLRSVMIWERQWHPCAIVGVITILYLLIWVMECSALTTLAVVGALINLADFLVPIASNTIYGPTAWNGIKEKTFEDMCRSIVLHVNKVWHHIKAFFTLRETSPCMYYMLSISSLIFLAWLASAFNGILMMYVLTLCLTLYPGVQSRGVFNMLCLTRGKGDKEK